MEIEASNAYHAAAIYCGACVVRRGDRVILEPDDLITIRLGEKVCRVTRKTVMAWANWRANENSRQLAASRRRKPWRAPRAGPEDG